VPTQPPVHWVQGTLSLRPKWPGREAKHSPPSSAEVKNAWSYTSTPHYAFMAWCSVKKSTGITLPFYLLPLIGGPVCLYTVDMPDEPKFMVIGDRFIPNISDNFSPNWLPLYSGVLLEKLMVTQLVKKFPAFYGPRRFITMLTKVHHCSPTWARCTQSTTSRRVSLRSILILSSRQFLGLLRGLFPTNFPAKIFYVRLSPLAHACYMPRLYHPDWCDHPIFSSSLYILRPVLWI
jgi:hypothetical protein